jgi:sortase A
MSALAVRRNGGAVPDLPPRLQLVRAVVVLVFVLCTGALLELVVVSSLQASAAQGREFSALRSELATGTAPIGPADDAGHELALGAPVAFVEIPSIGLREVIGQGTTPGVLFDGPGHRRDTPFPGQLGTSIVYGRRAAFGGPFSRIAELKHGAAITVTTGQGTFQYQVLAVRREGDVVPSPPVPGAARLVLVTAAGTAFLPEGILRVDADLQGRPVVGGAPLVTANGLPSDEQAMSGDSSTLWAFALWLQALLLLAVGAAWAWHRWGRAQAWVVFLPPLVVVGLAASGEAARLLPNLL